MVGLHVALRKAKWAPIWRPFRLWRNPSRSLVSDASSGARSGLADGVIQGDDLFLAQPRAVERDALGLRLCGTKTRDHRLELVLDVRLVVAVEKMADEAALQVARLHRPVGHREREVHIAMHHDPHVVVRDV